MKIGELAKTAGVTAKTIRFYEEEGLLPKPERTVSGYRTYGPEDTERLEFIHKAKRLGISLDEIRGILRLHDRSDPTCTHVRALIDSKVGQVDEALEDLHELRAELTRLRDESGDPEDCRPSGGRICGIIEGSNFFGRRIALAWIADDREEKASPVGIATTPTGRRRDEEEQKRGGDAGDDR